MCPICGTTLGLSGSPAAEREREFIREQIALGLDKEEIKDALVAEYGPEVLAVPETAGFDLAAWVVPGLALIAGAGALAVGIRRWRRDGSDDEPPPASGSAGDEEQLATDLGRYDL
jgi:cytochrome c-type biogenesis protein CcmH